MKDPRIHRAAREENSHALAELATASGSSAR
jgi:hypothetical protein